MLLEQDFYARDTLTVARDLLGKVLYTRVKGADEVVAARIVETEAYREGDPAAHSCRGKTPRSEVMFGEPGRVYVYFIYGMYEMLNFVTEPEGRAGAVLIRAGEPIQGEEIMTKRRKSPRSRHDLSSGPGKLCRALGIEMSHNRVCLMGPEIWVEDDGFQVEKIRVSPRVGISKGQDRLWRYYIEGNSFVSRSPLNKQSIRYRK